MKLRRIYAIYLRQLFLLRRNPTRFGNIFVWILLDIVLWGFITKYLDSATSTNFSFVPALLGAIILWDFLVRVQQGLMLAFFEDSWARNFLNLFASPLKLNEYVAGLVLTAITTSLAGLIFMVLLAGLFFGYNLLTLGFGLTLFLLGLFLFGIAMGIFAVAMVLRFGPSAEWFAWPIPFAIAPFVGIYYPLATLPHAAQIIGQALPPSYTFEGMRQFLLLGTISMPDLLMGFALSVAYILLAYLFLARMYKKIMKSGLLTRFSAESTE